MSPGCVQCNETLHIALVIQQPICLETFNHGGHHRCIVAVLQKLTRQFSGGMVATRQEVERGGTRGPRIEGIKATAGQDVRLP